jgi:hypothetical protein
MPDEWERHNGLDLLDAEDRNGDGDGDGFTNLEEYLNGFVRFTERLTTPVLSAPPPRSRRAEGEAP